MLTMAPTYKLLIVDEIGDLPINRGQANLFFQWWRDAMNVAR